jgi:hypothetical protein
MNLQRTLRLARSGKQPGDPDKAAALLMQVNDAPNPPVRVFAGFDALALVAQKLKRVQAEISAWEDTLLTHPATDRHRGLL